MLKTIIASWAVRFSVIVIVVIVGLFFVFQAFYKSTTVFSFNNDDAATVVTDEPVPTGPTLEERIAQAQERSQEVRGVYMTALVASSVNGAGKTKRDRIVDLIATTELNAVVIDVKEVAGSQLNENLISFVQSLKKQGIWTIARVPLMRDSSEVQTHSDWYLQRTDGRPWADALGHYWLDPAQPEVATYLSTFAKNVIDAGFDEIQTDYIRYPSDGNLRSIASTSLPENKFTVIDTFSRDFVGALKEYKPEIIVSTDLFGYIATLKKDNTIGQRLEDLGKHFDYISLMLYPSHFYAGFSVPADAARNLPALSYGYGVDPSFDVVARPYQVIYRSTLAAQDVVATSSGKALMRPFLQDFNLSFDRNRGIVYGSERVRAQIDGAQDAGASGWLLWNASNNYTEQALQQ